MLIERGLQADPSRENSRALAAKVARLAEAELFGHFEVEETVLFPAARPHLASGRILDELIGQHRALEALVRRIADAGDDARAGLLLEFGELLRRHIRTEERQLFEEVQATLDPARRARLGADIEAKVERVCPSSDRLPWEEPESA